MASGQPPKYGPLGAATFSELPFAKGGSDIPKPQGYCTIHGVPEPCQHYDSDMKGPSSKSVGRSDKAPFGGLRSA